MPSKPDKADSDKDAEEWITIGGKKMRIDAGEDKEDITREPMPSARGEKQANTKEAQKVYKKRLNLIKSIFKPSDLISFISTLNDSGTPDSNLSSPLTIVS